MTHITYIRLSACVLAAACISACNVKPMSAGEGAPQSSSISLPLDHTASGALEQSELPASDSTAVARLSASPRHGEWATIQSGKNPVTGVSDSTRAFIVYPQRSDKAPVVIVIHEIFGLSPWIRAVADQLAADGFIAIAPDLLTMKNLPGNLADGPDPAQARAIISSLTDEELHRQLDAVARYGMALPAATSRYGVVGYCWGGTASFKHAIHAAALGAAVVYYGSTPDSPLASIKAPVLGLYGGNDNRVNATVPHADSAMKVLSGLFEYQVFEGAGHGFLRQQAALANLEASRKAWPLTVHFLKKHLEST